jgi:hypothetical protein
MLVHGPIEINGEWIEPTGVTPAPVILPSNPVAREIQRMIVAFNVAAVVLRADSTAENLFGNDDVPHLQAGLPIWIEFVSLSPEDIAQKIDAKASVLPGADVLAEDRMRVGADVFRVQTVDPQNWFGVVTHKTIQLVRHHGTG